MSDWEYAEYAETLDTILAQTTALLARRGDEQCVALLVDVQGLVIADTDEVVRTETDAAWGTTRTVYAQQAILDVEDHLIPRFTPDVQSRLLDTLGYVASRNGESGIAHLSVRPALPEVDANWRETFAARLSADEVSNQARRERDRPGYPVEDDMTFGSKEELIVYQALKEIQQDLPAESTIAILPSPGARLRAGHTWTPDFVVIGNGRALVIEVDGPHHRQGRRYADDKSRDLQWSRCRVNTVRLVVEELSDTRALKSRLREELNRNFR